MNNPYEDRMLARMSLPIERAGKAEKLEAVNVKLVEALEDALDSWQFGESIHEGHKTYDKARAALALAKGEA